MSHQGGTLYLDNILLSSTAPIIEIVPLQAELRVVEPNSTALQLVTVRNIGTAPLTVSSATVSTPFTVSPGSFTVQPNSAQSLTLSLVPVNTGTYSGQLAVTSNSVNNTVVTIPVRGRCVSRLVMTPPNAPQNVRVSASPPNPTITWDPVTSNAQTYRIYSSDSGYFTPPTTGQFRASVNHPMVSFTDTGSIAARFYRVTSANELSPTWSKTYGNGSRNEQFFASTVTFNGGAIAVGTDHFYRTDRQLYVVRTNGLGDTLWTCRYSAYSIGNNVIQLPDSNFLVTGYIGTATIFAIKIDQSGNILWNYTTQVNLQSYFYKFGVVVTWEGGIAIAAQIYYGTTGDVLLLKLTAQGQFQWSQRYDLGTACDAAASLLQLGDGSFVFAGIRYGAGAVLGKTNASGQLQWTRTYGSGTDNFQAILRITTADSACLDSHKPMAMLMATRGC